MRPSLRLNNCTWYSFISWCVVPSKLIGRRFKKLVVLSLSTKVLKSGRKARLAVCKCDCGNLGSGNESSP